MGVCFSFKESGFGVSNLLFNRLHGLGLEIAERIATADERQFVEVIKDRVYWPGRDVDITEDYPTLDEQKFWCRVYFELSRAIFERLVGEHEHQFWQANTIYLSYKLGLLFREAVYDAEKNWYPKTTDGQEQARWNTEHFH